MNLVVGNCSWNQLLLVETSRGNKTVRVTKPQTTRHTSQRGRIRSAKFSKCLWPPTSANQTSNHIVSLLCLRPPRTLRSTPPGHPTPSWGTRPSPGGRRAWPHCCPRCSGCGTAASPPHRASCSLTSSRDGLDEKHLYKKGKKAKRENYILLLSKSCCTFSSPASGSLFDFCIIIIIFLLFWSFVFWWFLCFYFIFPFH